MIARRHTLLAMMSLLLGSTALAGDLGTAVDGNGRIGRKVESFTLRDFRGKQHSLDDFSDAKLVVLAILGTECPLAKLYAPRLQELANEFAGSGVAFLGIMPNQQDSTTEMAAFARIHGVAFPLLKDVGNAVADRLNAVRTPEVFLIDQDRRVRYWGRIDDQYGFTALRQSYQQPEPQRRDLAVAIEELLSGHPVSVPFAEAPGCHIGRVRKPDPRSKVTYSNQIVRILNANCVFCHREGQIAPFTLTSYEDAVGWAEMVREVVEQQRMPPWHADARYGRFANDARLSDEDKRLIDEWVSAGAPEGDPSRLPDPPKFAKGWEIPEPDEIIYMRDKPYRVPAQGVVEYQDFVVDPGWKEDRWIQAIEPRPGNPAVVHHILVFVSPPRKFRREGPGQLRTEWIGAFAPVIRQSPLDPGMARFIPAGSKLIFQLHYTPNGSEQLDRSYLGVVFADPSKIRKEVAVASAGNYAFRIPPGDPSREVVADYTFSRDSILLRLMPHMHLRGKDFRFDAIYPDGKTEILLSVPHYDFGWQTIYTLEEPKRMPAGTTLHCVAHFDNSEDNLNNPDPTKTITFGEQTWDEMMIGFFEMALADQDLIEERNSAVSRMDEFQTLYKTNGTNFDETTTRACRRALESAHWFERFAQVMGQKLPQLDRLGVTYVEDGKLRLLYAKERPPFRGTLRSTSTRVTAEHTALARYAEGHEIVVNQDLASAPGTVLKRMRRKGIQSSLHVPGEKDGLRGTINFWSAEENAFPPEAVEVIKKAVALALDQAESHGLHQ